ncbi:hypothetical protein BDR06DRAFT_972092 [Suillus hirtellus]|nr:hypothetical protein BDR06DRAFT_972092 [Suillus hirtellus]
MDGSLRSSRFYYVYSSSYSVTESTPPVSQSCVWHGSTAYKFNTITSFAGSASGSGAFGYLGRGETKRATSRAELGKYAEDEDDIFGNPGGTNQRGLAEDDLETNLQSDKNAWPCNVVNQLVDELIPSAPNFQLRDACDRLLMSSHGILTISEVLEGECSRDAIMRLLHIVDLLVMSDFAFVESFCLIGETPVMMGMCRSPKEVDNEGFINTIVFMSFWSLVTVPSPYRIVIDSGMTFVYRHASNQTPKQLDRKLLASRLSTSTLDWKTFYIKIYRDWLDG